MTVRIPDTFSPFLTRGFRLFFSISIRYVGGIRIAYLCNGQVHHFTPRKEVVVIRKLVGCFIGLVFLAIAGTAHASIIWTVSGQVDNTNPPGVDTEMLAGASLILSITIDPGVYEDIFAFPHAQNGTVGPCHSSLPRGRALARASLASHQPSIAVRRAGGARN